MTDRLAGALRAQGGVLGELVNPGVGGSPEAGPAQKAASGPRAAQHREEYELLLEMILEGSRLHYGTPQVVRTEDPDLALLLGDQLYALGLSRLAALGDLDAVRALAEAIAALAQAHAEGDGQRDEEIWLRAAVRIGWGQDPDGAGQDGAAATS